MLQVGVIINNDPDIIQLKTFVSIRLERKKHKLAHNLPVWVERARRSPGDRSEICPAPRTGGWCDEPGDLQRSLTSGQARAQPRPRQTRPGGRGGGCPLSAPAGRSPLLPLAATTRPSKLGSNTDFKCSKNVLECSQNALEECLKMRDRWPK